MIFRSIIFYAGYVVITIFMSSLFILSFPFLAEKKRTVIARMWCSGVMQWLALSCQVRYHVEGADRLPDHPVVVLANHQSSWETVFLFYTVTPVAPILKKELLRIPFWGWALRLQKHVAIDRSKPREAGKSLLQQGRDRLQQGYSIVIFPEGTRRAIGAQQRFSRGGAKLALHANSDVVFVAHNAGSVWPPGTFMKNRGTISVVISEPIPVAGHTADTLTKLAESWISEQLERVGAAL